MSQENVEAIERAYAARTSAPFRATPSTET